MIPSTRFVSSGYDGLGRMSTRTVGTGRTDYWYDATGMSLETGASSGTYLRSPGGQLLSEYSGGNLSNYFGDRLGNITATLNSSGNLVNTYTYDPWGKQVGSTITRYNQYRYSGAYQDAQTAFYVMGARYYQNTTGRFTQEDPRPSSVFEPNRYSYAGDNPANAKDPSGLMYCDSEECGIFGGGAAAPEGGALSADGGGDSASASWVDDIWTTDHGYDDLVDRGWTRADYDYIMEHGTVTTQADGGRVYIVQPYGQSGYNVLVENAEGQVVSALPKGLDAGEVMNLARNYGWGPGWWNASP